MPAYARAGHLHGLTRSGGFAKKGSQKKMMARSFSTTTGEINHFRTHLYSHEIKNN